MIREIGTGKWVDICFRELIKSDVRRYGLYQKNGWFQWNKEFKTEENRVFGLFVPGNTKLQGAIALQDHPENQLVHIKLMETSPLHKAINPFRKFEWIGVNLLCLAFHISFHRGYDGYVGLEVKMNVNDVYYRKLGALQARGTIPPYYYFRTDRSVALLNEFMPGGVQWCQRLN